MYTENIWLLVIEIHYRNSGSKIVFGKRKRKRVAANNEVLMLKIDIINRDLKEYQDNFN